MMQVRAMSSQYIFFSRRARRRVSAIRHAARLATLPLARKMLISATHTAADAKATRIVEKSAIRRLPIRRHDGMHSCRLQKCRQFSPVLLAKLVTMLTMPRTGELHRPRAGFSRGLTFTTTFQAAYTCQFPARKMPTISMISSRLQQRALELMRARAQHDRGART